MDFRRWFVCVTLILAMGLPGLMAQDKDEDISPALKDKYMPLFEEMQKAFEAGQFDQSLKQGLALKKSIEKDLEPTHTGVLMANVGVALSYLKLKKFKEAEPIFTELISRLQKKKLGDTEKMAFVLENQRDFYDQSGNATKAKAIDAQLKKLRQAHPEWDRGNDDQKEKNKDNPWDHYGPRFNQVYELLRSSDPEGALHLAETIVHDADQQYGSSDAVAIQSRRVLAMVQAQLGNYDQAEATLAEAEQGVTKAGRSNSIDVVFLLQAYQDLYRQQGQDEKTQQVEQRIQTLIAKDPEVQRQWAEEQKKQEEKRKNEPPRQEQGMDWKGQLNKARGMYQEGKQEEAIRMVREFLEKARPSLPPNDPFFKDAEATLKQFERDRKPAPPPPPPERDPNAEVQAFFQRADELRAQGKKAEAEKVIAEMREFAAKTFGDRSQAYATALVQTAFYYSPEPNPRVDLKALYRQAIALLEKDPGPGNAYPDALSGLGRILLQKDKNYDQAEPLLKKAAEVLAQRGPDGEGYKAMADLADLYLASNKNLPEADRWYQNAMEFNDRREQPDDIWQSIVLRNVGQSAFAQGRFDEAETIWKQDEVLMVQVGARFSDFRPDFAGLYDRLIALYTKTGKAADLKVYQEKSKKLLR